MRDQDHGCVGRLERLLEPLDVVDVEVVGRLVQKEQVGIAAERARERGPGQLAARERIQLSVEVVVRKAEPAQGRVDPLPPGVAAGVLQPCLRL